MPRGRERRVAAAIQRVVALEPRDELVELQLLEPLADRVEFAGAVLDELTTLLDEVERLSQAGLAGIEPADDLLDAGDGGLVRALGHGVVSGSTRAGSASS